MADKEVQYTFTGQNGKVYAIQVMYNPNTGAIDSIAGLEGKHAITGELGTGGSPQSVNGTKFDNSIFMNSKDGVGGSKDGIDGLGIGFQANGHNFDLFYDAATHSFEVVRDGHYKHEHSAHLDGTTFCFCAGTMVATADGETAVEALSIGDLVRTDTGEMKAVRWVGRRVIATRFADPQAVLPVRIKAGAIAEHTPSRDLLLSPCHAVAIDGALIQAGALVNGTTVVRETEMGDSFTYYHVELHDHSLILAEGLATETFIDNVDRMAFDNWSEHEALYAGSAALVEMTLPRAKSSRQVPYAIRARLAARSNAVTGIDTAIAA